jgi:hypothetical protein
LVFNAGFNGTVGVCLLDPAIWVFSDPRSIWVQDVFLATGVLDSFDATLLYPLDRAIGEDGLLFAVDEDALDCAVREATRNDG